MVSFDIKVDASKANKLIASVKARIPTVLRSEMQDLAKRMKEAAQKAAIPHPGLDTGRIASTIHYETILGTKDITVKLGTKDIAAITLNNGRRAGAAPPPYAEIKAWAAKHGVNNAFMVARAIGAHGSSGIGFMQKATLIAQAASPEMASKIAAGLLSKGGY